MASILVARLRRSPVRSSQIGAHPASRSAPIIPGRQQEGFTVHHNIHESTLQALANLEAALRAENTLTSRLEKRTTTDPEHTADEAEVKADIIALYAVWRDIFTLAKQVLKTRQTLVQKRDQARLREIVQRLNCMPLEATAIIKPCFHSQTSFDGHERATIAEQEGQPEDLLDIEVAICELEELEREMRGSRRRRRTDKTLAFNAWGLGLDLRMRATSDDSNGGPTVGRW
ncbi:hypothetical protein I317_04241 [Kwoniella heveanensis CBS 569]|nr:hypothetical protein I317_04241 [Kwoniella heveanensis CBS 569]